MSALPYFLAATSRSGSNFIMDVLNATDKIGFLKEHLYHHRENMMDYDDDTINACWTEAKSNSFRNGYWGTKIDPYELKFVNKWFEINGVFQNEIKWIWLSREDKIAQAISSLKAHESGVWHVIPDNKSKADYKPFPGVVHESEYNFDIEIDLDDIPKRMALYYALDKIWERYFDRYDILPLRITYEDYIAPESWADLIERVFDFLGVDCPKIPDIKRSDMKHIRQSKDNKHYKAFLRRYLPDPEGIV